MRKLLFSLIIASLCSLNTANAQTPIYKCVDADGNVEYSQFPCVTKKPVEPEETEPDTKAEIALPQDEPEPTIDRSACRKRYRDAIDAIDLEIGREYSPEKAERYKQRLLILTRKLRQC